MEDYLDLEKRRFIERKIKTILKGHNVEAKYFDLLVKDLSYFCNGEVRLAMAILLSEMEVK